MTFAQRMSRLGTATAFEVLARARALEATGREVVHLEIGEPDFDTPRFIRQAAAAALEEGFTHYGPSAGLPEFRQVIAEIWRRQRGIPCEADHVLRHARAARGGGRGALPRPGLPDLRIGRPLHQRAPGATRSPRGQR